MNFPECTKCHKLIWRSKSGLCRTCLNLAKRSRTKTILKTKRAYAKNQPVRIQKDIDAGVILPSDTPLIYENYKEPLRKVEKGHGFMGTLATNQERTHVQCHICGLLFRALPAHLCAVHKINARAYKEEFGLALTTALLGDATREQRISLSEQKTGKGELLPGLVQYNHDIQTGKRVHKRTHDMWSLEQRNKHGLCPDQVLEKIKTLMDELGRVPSCDEFRAHYNSRFVGSLVYQFGSWNNAVKALGQIPVGEQMKLERSPEKLLQALRDFREQYGRVPVTSDWRRGLLPPRYHYHKTFGTLNDARVAAGMNAIIALPRHRWMEIPAEEWDAYRVRISTISLQDRRAEANKRYHERKAMA